MTTDAFPWRPLGTLLVDKGFLTPPELDEALAEQRRSRRLLGQILVERSYLSSFSLSQTLAEQHGVGVRARGDLPASKTAEKTTAWRPLGRVIVEMGLLSEAGVNRALEAQRSRPDARLGEILIERRWLSGLQLLRALANQQGVGFASGRNLAVETTLRPATTTQALYRVFNAGRVEFQSTNFLDAADFAFELLDAHEPPALEIRKVLGDTTETVWTYCATAAASRGDLVETFGFDPTRWKPDLGSGPGRRT
jgi:hypothetical protein